ncbi:unnamed protein product [Paramecium sonneborni]|uniref:Uncharacterized protein n=1 Tax=Paramecium sonneborni TaxID=65129 RepID=A0A8S1QC35_9CILI|nr:unnamed protein product [Paramecium sonneborni]
MQKILLFIGFSLIQCSIPLVCSDVKKESDCQEVINGINDCIWSGGQCQIKTCDLITSPCDGEAYVGFSCSSSKKGCKSVKQCLEIDNADSCSKVTPKGQQCFWEENCRLKQCKDNSKETCYDINGQQCIYQNNICTTFTDCGDITEIDKCNGNISNKSFECTWMNEKCVRKQCNMIINEEDCHKNVLKSENCFYGQISEEKKGCLSCSLIEDSCLCNHYNLFGCVWKQDRCYKQSCSSFTTIDECTQAYDSLTCTWYSPMNKCITIDYANELDRQCDIYSYSQGLQILLLVILLIF